jgi:hypothetical protein
MLMRLDNTQVYARSQTEVVRVNNQPPHDASLAGTLSLTAVCAVPYTARVPQMVPIIELAWPNSHSIRFS